MNERSRAQDAQSVQPEVMSSTLMDSIAVLLRWWRFIIFNVLVVAVITLVIVFLLPKWYRATTSVLPPKQQDLFGSVGAASSVLKSLTGMSKLGQKPSGYNYFAILKSRTVNEHIVRKYDLLSVYEIGDSSMEKALKALSGNVAFEDQTDDYITIEVLDRDPVRAAAMANSYVDLLNELSFQLATQEARNNREFIGKRLLEGWTQLHNAEDSLRAYQEKSGVMITPEQQETLKPIAALYAMKVKKEIELAVLLRSTTEDNPAVQQLRVELLELNKKLSGFPEIGLQSLRLYRDVMIQERIVEFLTPVYEQSRIEEVKDVPVVLVLDKAVPPERKAKPQRLLIVLAVSTLVLFLCVALVYMMQALLRREGGGTSTEQGLRRRAQQVAKWYRVRLEP